MRLCEEVYPEAISFFPSLGASFRSDPLYFDEASGSGGILRDC